MTVRRSKASIPPPNIHVAFTTFPALRERIQRCFNFPVCLPTPYKLCDFKVAYGLVFKEELKNFDFWGYCDCDLVFGNVRKFITEEILARYDRIFANGHFTLIRNTPEATTLFMQNVAGTPTYKEAFSSPRPFAFDEWGGSAGIWEKLAPDKFFRYGAQLSAHLFDDLLVGKKHFVSNKRPPREDLGFVWRPSGQLLRVFRNGAEESLYVHFQKRKMQFCDRNGKKARPTLNNKTSGMGGGYIFVPNKILPFFPEFERDKALRHRLCRKRLVYPGFLVLRWKNLRRKIREFLGERIR